MKIDIFEFFAVIVIAAIILCVEYFFNKSGYIIIFITASVAFSAFSIFVYSSDFRENKDWFYIFYKIAVPFFIFSISVAITFHNFDIFNGYLNTPWKRTTVSLSALTSVIYIRLYFIEVYEFNIEEKKQDAINHQKWLIQNQKAIEEKKRQEEIQRQEAARKAKEPKPMTRKEKSVQDILDKLDRF